MRQEEVAKYLKDHPEFFDDYAELLSSVQVRHPYGGRAIPLSERQVLALRERTVRWRASCGNSSNSERKTTPPATGCIA